MAKGIIKDSEGYWETRGSFSYKYKDETFYTVTPIPFYFRRRWLLLELMTPFILDPTVINICDFGCGDGWYIKYFSSKCEGKKWYGVDLSYSMIERARQACPNTKFEISRTGILNKIYFDLIYSVAVFAHIMSDSEIKEILVNICSKLNQTGYFLMFEATGPRLRKGRTWCRRQSSDYVDLVNQSGFIIKKRCLIAYPFHRLFERRIAPYYYRFFSKGENSFERCINANKSIFFKLLSSMMLSLTFNPVRKDDGRLEGNSFYVLKKSSKSF